MSKPDYFSFDEYKTRQAKLQEIKDLGVNPYPHRFETTHTIEKLIEAFVDEETPTYDEAMKGDGKEVALSGRVMLHRSMGKNIFSHIQEGGARVQVLFNRDTTKVHGLAADAEISAHKFNEKKIDLGDIIGVRGHVFRTNRGELTVFVKEMTLLTKSLLPLPDKHSGLTNKELRYRKRWIDMISNADVLKTFEMRSKILSMIRKYFDRSGFLEVETPILEGLYGGAQAKPFTTHLNALHKDMYMRIALEIALKKLIVGGMSKVYEIGKLFRNEGIDATHNPEFTSIEAYAANWDYNDVMDHVEKLYEFIALELFGTTVIGLRKDRKGNSHNIDVKAPWKRISMHEALRVYEGIEVDELSDEEMREILLTKTELDKDKVNGAPRGILISLLFEEFVEDCLIQPHFITDFPIETTPLCKLHRDPKLAEKGIVERFEGYVLGMEICNAYSELNDPILQRELLEEQERLLESGDEEACPMDEDFLEAICQGMPPAGGVGIGIDRLIMLFCDEISIRDVIFFPVMKSQGPSPALALEETN